jgi:serine/threonine protein kinase
MGAVYEAEQAMPRRIVALKVIRPGLVAPDLRRRFENEVQVLGRLQHPGIAQIYQAGVTDLGGGPQPYFAMELVSGLPLVDYAERRGLGLRERLRLLAGICDAVQHAHQRGIIHRDLKPGNILVDDASGQPKILDFGIARTTDPDGAMTSHTLFGQIVGTLPYMSPEQLAADPGGIDTRSDVYALGVILHELLTGKLPHDLTQRSTLDAMNAIRDVEPARVGTLDRRLRGDVETIVAKALEKEKERRYASAAELAADIHRYLSDEPIVARPPSAGYQLRKFARRNKVLVGGIASAFLILISGVVPSATGSFRVTRRSGEWRSSPVASYW